MQAPLAGPGPRLDQAILGGFIIGHDPLAGRAEPAGLEGRPAGQVMEGLVAAWIGGPAAPVRQQAERARQGPAVGGQGVLHPRRPLGIGHGVDDSLALEPAEALGQDVRGDPGNPGQEVVETGRAIEQAFDQEQAPAVADPIEGRSEGRGGID